MIPVMGPRMTALGESDFINPQISPALHISPFSFQTCRKEIIRMTEKVASMVPEKGMCRLCSRLPTIISKLAHKPPATAAFNHIEFNPYLFSLVPKASRYEFKILFTINIQE